MKVLVVHRQSTVTSQIKEQLANCLVVCLNNGLEGLIAARSRRFDLVISSFDLPVITGFEMIRSMRQLSLNSSVPVILLSESEPSEVDKDKYLARLMNASLLTLEEIPKVKSLAMSFA